MWPALLMFLLVTATPVAVSDINVENLSGTACRTGPHLQPAGPFAAYVFCDDALGTNIAVFYAALGYPEFNPWSLTRRFWQGGAWGADVQGIGWVPGKNLLVVATSSMYGTGSVYLLRLESQTSVTLSEPKACLAKIQAISERSVTVSVRDCDESAPERLLALPFPQPTAGEPKKASE